MVHSEAEYNQAVAASQILFGSSTSEALKAIDEDTFLAVFEGVPQFEVSESIISHGVPFSALAAEHTAIFPSKGDLRRTVSGGGVSINKEKVTDPELLINSSYLLNGKYLLVQKGKKNYFIVKISAN
jgi:tyrosyl-tRNA synthetase